MTSILGDKEFIKSHDAEMIAERSSLGIKRKSLEEILSESESGAAAAYSAGNEH